MLDPKEEIKLAEKRREGYLFSIFLFLGIAFSALLFTGISFFQPYTSYLNGATLIFGLTGLIDIGFYLFSRKVHHELKGSTELEG